MTQAYATPTPRIDPEACSLGRLAAARCSRCADTCPRGVLFATPEGLALDPANCSGCGGCAAACPQRAIGLHGVDAPQVATRTPSRDAVLVCPVRADLPGEKLCLQAMGAEALARLWLMGVRDIGAVCGDCHRCPDGKTLAIADRLAALNAILADRGLPGMAMHALASVPRGSVRIGPEAAKQPDLARRMMFGLQAAPDAGQPVVRAIMRLQSLPGAAENPPPRSLHVPRIDPGLCTGCDACLRICPTGALSLIKADCGELAYAVRSSDCSGCGLCVDLCSANAMAIDALAPNPSAIALTELRCRDCGVTVHVPTEGPWAGAELCPICTKNRHRHRLFQVLP